jgi:hypothetical protein
VRYGRSVGARESDADSADSTVADVPVRGLPRRPGPGEGIQETGVQGG